MKTIVLYLSLFLISMDSFGQSCCSEGVPLSSNLGLPWSEDNKLQTSLSYDLNLLNTLQDGTDKLDDNTRKRLTHTTLFQIGYMINKKIAVDVLVPYVRQERILTPKGLPSSTEISTGVGDAVALIKYRFYKNYQLGIGIKIPTGATTNTSMLNGLTLSADLQPGSGSWDIIYWLSGAQDLKFRPSASVNLTVTYRSTGENDSYLGNETYAFGNEFQATMNYSDQLLIKNLIITPYIGLRYRTVNADRVNDSDVPSTGGSWWFVRPGLGYAITPKLELQTVIDIPLYANLESTQVTPTLRFNFALFLKISTSKQTLP